MRRFASAIFTGRALADAALVEVAEQLGLGIAGDRDLRSVLVAEVVDPLDGPFRAPLEHLVRALLDHRAANVLVEVGGVDVTGADLVRDVGDLAHERRMLDQPGDEDVLALAHVRADLDRELGQGAKTSVVTWSGPYRSGQGCNSGPLVRHG